MKKNNQGIFFFALVFTFIFSSIELFSQENSSSELKNLYIYGFVNNTTEQDPNKLQLCTDLFYSQFESTSKFKVFDKRKTTFSQEIFETHKNNNDILFYHSISEADDEWVSTLYLVNSTTQQGVSITKNYKEFYKILMDAKACLTELLNKQIEKPIEQHIATEEKETIIYTIADMYGTWQGEEHIHKIVILGAGRGFVIFENGASMNVNIKVENQSLFVAQDCTSSADFFPNIPKEIATELANNAEPITWDLQIQNQNTLNGIKNTYAIIDAQNNTTDKTQIDVTWFR